MLIRQKLGTLDPFTDYFIQIANHFAAHIQFAASAPVQIEPTEPCFFIVSTLMVKLTGVESRDHVTIEVQQFITEVALQDPASINQLGQGVFRWLTLLADARLSHYPHMTEMIDLLVQSKNAIIDISNQINTSVMFSWIINNLARAILTSAGFNSAHIVSVLAEMWPPKLVNGDADI
jgi:hypothetical protein